MSLKVIEIGAIRKLGCGFYSPSIVTMAITLAVVRYPASKNSVTLKTGLGSFKASLKMTPIDRPYDFLLVGHCNNDSISYYLRVIWL